MTSPTPTVDSPALVLFDWDGTLVDSGRTIHLSMVDAFAQHGLEGPSWEDVRRNVGLRLETIVGRLAPNADAALRATLQVDYRAAFVQRLASPDFEERLFPGIRESLKALKEAGIVVGMATGKALPALVDCLRYHGLEDEFATLQTPTHNPGKPDPGMVLRGMAEVGATPERTVVVGDSRYDMQMARNAGVTALGVSWGFQDVADLEAAGAERILARSEDLAAELRERSDGAG